MGGTVKAEGATTLLTVIPATSEVLPIVTAILKGRVTSPRDLPVFRQPS